MGLFKSKDEKVLDFFESTYQSALPVMYKLTADQGQTGPYWFQLAHGGALRRAAKNTQDRFKVMIDMNYFDDAYLQISCAKYGFNYLEVVQAQRPF
jgi:hypothetical protein